MNETKKRQFQQMVDYMKTPFEGTTIGLFILNQWSEEGQQFHQRLNKRWNMMAQIDECRRADGKMWITESGMDCDCSRYSGHLHECDANIISFYKLWDYIGEWADGPFSLYPITEKQAGESRPTSRDLVMEAHEDGHPHSISSVRYESL